MERRTRNNPAWFLAIILALAAVVSQIGPDRAERLFLWRVTSPAGARAYLAGSIHLAGPGLYPLPEPFARAFEESGSLVVEVDTEALPLTVMNDFIAERGLAEPGRSLEDYLTPEARALLARSGWSRPEYAGYRPWLAALVIQLAALEKNGFSARYGLDKHFLDQAAARRLPVVELETFAEQMDLLADLSSEEAELFLQATLLEAADLPATLADFWAAWLRGDVAGFAELFFRDFARYPELSGLMDRLVIRRNHLMLERLKPLLDASGRPPFVVVGAGHLVGREGLLALLAGHDYRLEQLRQP
jgi:uncharacterized protein YbaP (TraB family)